MDSATVSKDAINYLNRFTTLPVLLDLLRRKRLVLLEPDQWEDRNDTEIMRVYKSRKKLKHLYALCFSHGPETIHHWKSFSDGIGGCCVEFNGRELRKVFDSLGLRHGPVTYRKLIDVDSGAIRVNDIPFTKRWPYRCEEEYRVISEDGQCREIDVPLWMINKITINQRMPDQVYYTIKDYLKEACDNPGQKIHRSTLYENRIWIQKFAKS